MTVVAKRTAPPSRSAVVAAWCHPGTVTGEFCQSLMLATLHDHQHGQHLLGKGGFLSLASGPRISAARTQIVDTFLGFPGQPEWLWMLDADMSFPADTLARLLKAADPDERPIVGGLCFVGGREAAPHPTLYVLKEDDGCARLDTILDWPRGDVVQVDATGAACVLVHRSVLERLAVHYPRPFPWFAETFLGDAQIGEDITFCLRARRLGIPVHVHTGVEVGHIKAGPIDLAYFDAHNERSQ